MSPPPDWVLNLASGARGVASQQLSRHGVPDGIEGRESAVLMLFGESRVGDRAVGDVLLIERAHTLRSHAGQPAFPGGRVDPQDGGPVDAALREAAEETGLNPTGVDVLTILPALWLPPSAHVVTPVLAWWRRPSPVRVVDPGEVASVHRVPIPDLVEPANRLSGRHPSGYVGPAFAVGGLIVWGFTAGIISALLDAAGLARPWDASRVVPLPPTSGALRP